MVDCAQVYTWLNRQDRPHLGAEAADLMLRLGDQALPLEQRQRAAVLAARAAKASEDALEQAEALVSLAHFWHGQNQVEPAHACLLDALAVYKDQPNQQHRQAVVLWLLGCLEWQQNLNNLACGRWRDARAIFEKLAEDSEDARQADLAAWYREAVGEFHTDLALTAEEATTWLNQFAPTYLCDDLVALRNGVVGAINRGDHPQAGQLVRYLIAVVNSRHDLDERAEAYLEGGLAQYQLLDLGEAVALLKVAVSLYRPHSHQQAVARWMLGLMQRKHPPFLVEAANHLGQSLDDFQSLLIDANQRGQRKQAAWYQQIIPVLNRASARQISS